MKKNWKKWIAKFMLLIAAVFFFDLLGQIWGAIDVGYWHMEDALAALASSGLFLGLYRIIDLLEQHNPDV